MTSRLELPLFPLGTVLFKNGMLPLHIFEPRYVKMIESAIETDTGFGVVLLRRGDEVHSESSSSGELDIYKTGTLASIRKHERLGDGRYNVVAEGGAKIKVETTWELDNHLCMAQVHIELDEPKATIRESDARLVEVLKQVTHAMETKGYTLEVDFDDASSVSMRLAEHLMMDVHYRQRLLETSNAYQRMDMIWDWLHDAS